MQPEGTRVRDPPRAAELERRSRCRQSSSESNSRLISVRLFEQEREFVCLQDDPWQRRKTSGEAMTLRNRNLSLPLHSR
jgi:hypothetical protein